jgi:DNA-binding NtrC family response regulator
MRKRILIADDEERILFILRGALARFADRYDIVALPSGREALAVARQAPVELLLTDLRMPEVDGIALTEAIKAENVRTPVIWMTAYGDDRVKAEAERLGVYCCLDKPLEIAEIRRAVRDALASVENAAAAVGIGPGG